ncbi:MAG: DUF3015 family protein [Nitrospiraceae bacterium]|nr:DUF3015 family protein [Nitrospiraceae bacterium]
MKRLVLSFITVLALLGFTTAGFAENIHENVGCGLGTMLLEKSKDSILIEILAATTNATLGNQTFGISSGTLGCRQPARWASNELNQFVAANMDSLAKDIAAGKGESLDTLAELMKIPSGGRAAFYSKLQANFAKIFTSENVQSADVIDNIVSVALS